MWNILLLVFISSLHTSSFSQSVRVRLVQHQVCRQEGEGVVCRCGPENNITYLGIRMEGFLRQQNLRQVRLRLVNFLIDLFMVHLPQEYSVSVKFKFEPKNVLVT